MIERLQLITQEIDDLPHVNQAEDACKAGVRWIQLRIKGKPYEDWKKIAIQVKEVCQSYGAKLIVNDSVKITSEINADGVHLGATDMMPTEASAILGNDFLIGGTANSLKDIIYLASAKVDYIGLGPFRFTKTKQNLRQTLGFEGYRTIIKQAQKEMMSIPPIVAIGGIRPEDIPFLANTGIHGIAVASAINLAENRKASSKEFLKIIEQRF